MGNPRGIDVSNFQGAFDWRSQAGKIGFGAAKAVEGTGFTDPFFKHNWDGMWELDRRMPRFAYLFFRAAQDPDAQAAHLVSTVKSHGLLPGDNFLFDLESTRSGALLNDGLTPAQCAPRAVRCMRKINALAPGHRVLPYMNPAWARAGGSAGMGAWFLWLAEYGVSQPHVPPPWPKWTFWQSSDDPLDTDQYNGTLCQLLAFTRMPDKR